MNSTHLIRASIALSVALLGAAHLSADVVETSSGARIVGKIVGIDAGKVVVETDYAGTIAVEQEAVSAMTTDDPIAVRLASGTRIEGTVSGPAESLTISSQDGAIRTTMGDVAASWGVGQRDPQLVALERKWAFEAAVDITGKSGNSSQLGTAFTFRATLAGPGDTLAFYTGYNRQETDDEKSADQFVAGIDYSNQFSGRYSWYVRDEGGFDRIKDIRFYNVAAAGIGYDFIKDDRQVLTGRAGFSFRNENYRDAATEDINSAGLDFGLNHAYTAERWKVVSRLSFVPVFEDLGNFRLTQETFFEIPLADPRWKVRLGLTNDYTSEPVEGLDSLDTTYFSRLVLSWK